MAKGNVLLNYLQTHPVDLFQYTARVHSCAGKWLMFSLLKCPIHISTQVASVAADLLFVSHFHMLPYTQG